MNRRQPGADVWIYMCVPPPMMTALADGFRRLEIPARRVHWEQFDIRRSADDFVWLSTRSCTLPAIDSESLRVKDSG